MAKIIHETTRKMSQLCRKIDVRWGGVLQRVSFVGHFFRFIWDRLVVCSLGKPAHYRRLPLQDSSSSLPAATVEEEEFIQEHPTVMNSGYDTDSDLVNLKISLLGDCHIGKTTFVVSSFSF